MAPTVRQLHDSRVLIAGGTSGIGLATALAFAAAGAGDMVLLGRDEGRGQRACERVHAAGPCTAPGFRQADANDPRQAAKAVAEALERMGRIDVLVNATVGAFLPRLLQEQALEEIPGIVQGQMLGPLLMSRAVLPSMRAQGGGVIINVASDAGKLATPGESVIGAAMAGIVMFSRTLAMEAKRDGVRVNVVTPSLVAGTGTYDRLMDDAFSSHLFGKASSQAMLGVTQPEDVAQLILFLSSPQAARITGQAISPNGGISAA